MGPRVRRSAIFLLMKSSAMPFPSNSTFLPPESGTRAVESELGLYQILMVLNRVPRIADSTTSSSLTVLCTQ